MRKKSAAFTLIELLIVVAIIAILAAIAVPNFLEAQTRSKVSRVRADLRTVATAMEAYRIDSNWYPLNYHNNPGFWTTPDPARTTESKYWDPASGVLRANAAFVLAQLTTPIAYLTSAGFVDPFQPNLPMIKGYNIPANTYWFAASTNSVPLYWRLPERDVWEIVSYGPDRHASWWPVPGATATSRGYSNPYDFLPYDPTNGTASEDDIFRTGPGGRDH